MIKGLEAVKERVNAAQRQRDGLVAKGRRAYRLGIELRDNPERDPSARTLWENGYNLERTKWQETLARWKG
jgi:hypothetical protein